MTDVHELLARTQRALGEAEAPLAPTAHDHLLAGVRRRRRRRHVGEALGATAVVVVLGTAAWLGLGRGATPQPADTPAPTPTASAPPTATADPTPTPAAELVPAPGAAGLPPASLLPEGTLEAATPGWVLTTQRPTYLAADFSDGVTAHVLDLVSPAGERYRVLDLPPELRIDVARWTAGEPEALVVVGTDGTAPPGPARLDLRTGELTPLAGLPEFATHLARTPDGTDLWADGDGRVVVHDGSGVVADLGVVEGPAVDRAGTRVAGRDGDRRPVVVDVATGEVTAVPAGTECWPGAWRGVDLLLSCMSDPEANPVPERVVRWDADAGGDVVEVDVTGVDSLPPVGGVEVGDGRVATMYSPYADCSEGWGLLDVDTGVLTPVPTAEGEDYFRFRAAGRSLYVQAMTICIGDAAPSRLLRYDVGTGESVELATLPAAGELPAGAQVWLTGMSSWVVGD